ncbi:hypothetical protein DEO72_LG5g1538 [Vigna unguiculata]|uniref:Uncharacterized protein n=1 Tax=Vigna unguiculata TaxID=3917 RepID=A0A4D6LY94_VIGUN|nr:hypothetical protein DEO72_LG5g1538 [Vigna unguiculata]
MTRGSLVTPTCFPPFLSVSNISAPTSSNKNFGSTERPTLKLDAFIPKKHVITIIFNPISLPTTQTKGYNRTNTMALRSPPASKATNMKYRNREEDFNRAFRCCNCSRCFHVQVLLEDEARCNDKMVVQVVMISAAAVTSMAEQWSSRHCLVDCAKDSRWVLPKRDLWLRVMTEAKRGAFWPRFNMPRFLNRGRISKITEAKRGYYTSVSKEPRWTKWKSTLLPTPHGSKSIQGLGMLPPFLRHHPMAKIKPSSPSLHQRPRCFLLLIPGSRFLMCNGLSIKALIFQHCTHS